MTFGVISVGRTHQMRQVLIAVFIICLLFNVQSNHCSEQKNWGSMKKEAAWKYKHIADEP